ncbi:Hypothetical protein PMT_2373 [Prochlorococcus marinus str. MIT 9313]|uniref:Uncharacterized protein n=1 Tax=Prochlorococcus marinus (strain MIT 9313) TaxID=74547 RepID=B9ER51_PROMM|nr:Hypothetical protein PMT_2373 [Prochlorococcus marinus str. MIT 9313]
MLQETRITASIVNSLRKQRQDYSGIVTTMISKPVMTHSEQGVVDSLQSSIGRNSWLIQHQRLII